MQRYEYFISRSVTPQLNNTTLLSSCNSLEVKRNRPIKSICNMQVISLALSYRAGPISHKRELDSTAVSRKYCVYNNDGFICRNASVNGSQGETSSYLDTGGGISLVRSKWIINYAWYARLKRETRKMLHYTYIHKIFVRKKKNDFNISRQEDILLWRRRGPVILYRRWKCVSRSEK